MSKVDLTKPFVATVGVLAREDKELAVRLGKVNRLLNDYAKELKKSSSASAEDLSNLDVIGSQGEVHPLLRKYATKHYRTLSTRNSQISNVKYLADALSGSPESKGRSKGAKNPARAKARRGVAVKANLPELLKPLWLMFPRVGGGQLRAEDRDTAPLTELGELALKVLIEVVDETKPVTLKELFVDCRTEIIQKVNRTARYKIRKKVLEKIQELRDRSGIKLGRRGRSLPVDKLPSKFRRQFEVFLKVAPKGIGSIKHLAAAAAKFENIELDPKGKQVIKNYQRAVLFGLSFIKLDGDVGVEDFLMVEPIEHEYEGRRIVEMANPLVDQLRFQESELKTTRKAEGKDSELFSDFTGGLKAIAACNGIFELHEAFNHAYRVKLDVDGRDARKEREKEVMTRKWLDGEILSLKKRFDLAVKTKSFKHSRGDLALVLFLPVLVVLRYLGYRQQCIRNCEVGRHITFNSNGTVWFKWKAREIKNKRPIDTVLSKKRDAGIKEIVLTLDVLWKYYRVVWKGFLMKHFRPTMGDAFFGFIEGGIGSTDAIGEELIISRFKVEGGESRFARVFKDYAHYLMNFDGIELADVNFHPHFLRGVCCDWMKDDLKMTWEQISKALGDTIATLQRSYYKEEKVQSATEIFAEVSRRRLAEEAAGETGSPSATVVALTERNRSLEEKNKSLEDQLERERQRVASLESEAKLKDERLADMMQQLLQGRLPAAFQGAALS